MIYLLLTYFFFFFICVLFEYSGCYLWTISFKTRNGDIPPLVVVNSLQVVIPKVGASGNLVTKSNATIGTQTFSVSTSSRKALSSGWATSACTAADRKDIERDAQKNVVIKRSSWERSDSQSFFFPALPKWCAGVGSRGVWICVFYYYFQHDIHRS